MLSKRSYANYKSEQLQVYNTVISPSMLMTGQKEATLLMTGEIPNVQYISTNYKSKQ